MNRIKVMEKEWLACFEKLSQSEFFIGMKNGSLTMKHYIGFLRETYYNVSHNPKKMALFQAHINTNTPALESKLLKHAAMEIGHDQLALSDLKCLGVDTHFMEQGRPLSTTEALTGFVVFQIQHRNPYAYLGYLYHLEALPTFMAKGASDTLNKMGIPTNAMSFLNEHAEADIVHLKWNQEYIEGFAPTESDFEAVLYGLRSSCELHGVMFQGIMDAVRLGHP